MEKKALLIGISEYDNYKKLPGALNDVKNLARVLKAHCDGEKNFEVNTLTTSNGKEVSVEILKEAIERFLHQNIETGILYFSGHGSRDEGVRLACLIAQNGNTRNPGISMSDLSIMVNRSQIKNLVLILDCCHGANTGNDPINTFQKIAVVRQGVSIMASSYDEALENKKGGFYTRQLVKGLDGAAAETGFEITDLQLHLFAEKKIRGLKESMGDTVVRQKSTLKWNSSTPILLRKCSASGQNSSPGDGNDESGLISLRAKSKLPDLFKNKNKPIDIDQIKSFNDKDQEQMVLSLISEGLVSSMELSYSPESNHIQGFILTEAGIDLWESLKGHNEKRELEVEINVKGEDIGTYSDGKLTLKSKLQHRPVSALPNNETLLTLKSLRNQKD